MSKTSAEHDMTPKQETRGTVPHLLAFKKICMGKRTKGF